MAVNGHHDHGNSYTREHLSLACRFRGIVHYHHWGKHGGIKTDKVLEELKVLNLDQQAPGRGGEGGRGKETGTGLNI